MPAGVTGFRMPALDAGRDSRQAVPGEDDRATMRVEMG